MRRPRTDAEKGPPTPARDPLGPTSAPHALYDLADVEAALGGATREDDALDLLIDGDRFASNRSLLRDLLARGDAGRFRFPVHATHEAIARVEALTSRAPHCRAVVDLVARHLRAARTTGTPVALPPLLLLGPPGVGKSWLMGGLARAMGVPSRVYPFNLSSLSDGLSGSHPVYRSSAPGLVARTLLGQPFSNPLILVDEVDKPPPAAHAGDPYRPLYAALEPENARRFLDEHVQVPIDASQVMWILAANAVAGVPAPILDRLTVLEVGDMAAGDRVAVLRSVYADANARYRGFFDVEPSVELLDRLAAARPRRARLAIEDAMTRAAADERRSVRASDVADATDLPRVPPRRRGMH